MDFPAETDDFYKDHILDHYEDPFHRGHCQHPTHAHEEKNPLCGDVIHIDLELDDAGGIRDLHFDGEGCRISQAAASMLMERMEGKTAQDVENFSAQDMLELFGARLTPNRQKCCLLSWKVLRTAIHSPVANGEGNED